MTREDIIKLANKAWDRDEDLWLTREQYFLERFAALVAERDADLLRRSHDELSNLLPTVEHIVGHGETTVGNLISDLCERLGDKK